MIRAFIVLRVDTSGMCCLGASVVGSGVYMYGWGGEREVGSTGVCLGMGGRGDVGVEESAGAGC